MDDKLDRAYAIAGIAIGLVIIIISVDLLTGGRLAAVFGKPPKLSVVPRETSEENAS